MHFSHVKKRDTRLQKCTKKAKPGAIFMCFDVFPCISNGRCSFLFLPQLTGVRNFIGFIGHGKTKKEENQISMNGAENTKITCDKC